MITQEYYDSEQLAESFCQATEPRAYMASKIQLFAVIVYIISQGFAIPILAVGPSWAVWPRLDDFATLFLFLVYLGSRSRIYSMDRRERFFYVIWIVLILYTIPSTLVGVLMRPELSKGLTFGVFQTFRVFEYGLVWLCIRGMSFSRRQFDVITRTFFCVFIFVLIICIGNVTGFIPASRLVAHLPQGPVCGPWLYVHTKTSASEALGPYGWNPHYLDVQLICIMAVILAASKPSLFFRIFAAGAIGIIIIMSGSRAPLAGFAVALAIWSSKSIKQFMFLIFIIVIGAISFHFIAGLAEVSVIEYAFERTQSLVGISDPTLSGRTGHWRYIFEFIINNPMIFITGVGWGFSGHVLGGITTAHNTFLQAFVEMGIFGASLFFIFLFAIYRLLLGNNPLKKAVRSALLGLMVVSLTHETLYPYTNNGSFHGLLLAIVAIAGATERGFNIEESYYAEYESEQGEHFNGC
ncbi:MAG: O-antigen ligase family protein [Sedimentisphaerales bacterium]|nr:O-antigen ligase family protein [Sedimentisphaerales bacterium]